MSEQKQTTIRQAACEVREQYGNPSQLSACERELQAFREALIRWRSDRESYIGTHEQFIQALFEMECGIRDIDHGYPAPSQYGAPNEERVLYYLDAVLSGLSEIQSLDFLMRDFCSQ